MKRYSVARARERLAEVLDLAEQGESVLIERRGIEFVVTPARQKARRKPVRAARIEIVDASVERGQWTWSWTETGFAFTGRRMRTRKTRG